VASRLILGAEVVSGAEAARLGIVQWAAEPAVLATEARARARRYAEMPRLAVDAAKKAIAAAGDPNANGFDVETDGARVLLQSPDTRALVAAFLAKSLSRQKK
jgi:enoyl-CoA hydratase